MLKDDLIDVLDVHDNLPVRMQVEPDGDYYNIKGIVPVVDGEELCLIIESTEID